jgi:membrane protease YdiL (CAAX protease family)
MNTSMKSSQSTSTSRSLQQVMRRHPLFFFFLIAYTFSWIVMIPYVLSVWGNWRGDFTVIFVIKSFGPALAAFVMTNLLEGKAGVRRLQQRIKQWRAGWPWYLFILVGIPALTLLGIIIQPGALAGFQGLPPLLLVSYAVYFVVVIFGGGPLGEEPGWRGFALPRMQPRYGPLWGTLLLGVGWCCWHFPDFLTPAQGGGPGTGLATILTNFSMFFLMVIALAIIFTWVFNHTAGSVFIAIVLHASVNTPQLVLVPLFPAVGYTSLLLAHLIGFGVTALLIVILTRGRLGYEPSQATAQRPGQIEAQPSH